MLYVLIIFLILWILVKYILNKKIDFKGLITICFIFGLFNILTYRDFNFSITFFNLFILCISLSITIFIQNRRKKPMIILLICLFSFFLEYFVFNYHHFTTFFYKEKSIDNVSFDDIKKEGKTLTLLKDNAKIQILNIHDDVKNIYLDIDLENDFQKIHLFGNDDGNSNVYNLGNKVYVNNIEKSKYFTTYFYGKAKNIYLMLELPKGSTLTFNKIIINKNVPLMFNYLRFLIVCVILNILFFIRPRSSLYKYKLFEKHLFKKYFFMIFIIFSIIFFFCVTNINTFFRKANLDSYYEYYDLTESILKGHFYIDKDVPQFLEEMENPYDASARQELLEEHGYNSHYQWDYAFYKGKFYVYFGILPVLILFLPFYCLFHFHIPLHYALFMFLMFGVITAIYFTLQLCKRYFSKVSLITYFLGLTVLVFCSGFVFMARRPDIYVIPIVCALSFTLLGLGLWLSVSSSKKKNFRIFLGTFCIALTSLCRPQFLITLLFAYPLLKDNFYQNKKWNIKNILYFILPLILVGLFAMYYNYVRFDSIFDFGAAYNLTTNDMTKRGIHLERFGLGYFYYFLSPVNIVPTFPFIAVNNYLSNYLGITVYENFLGGLLFSTPVVLVGLSLIKKKKEINNSIYNVGILCYLLAFVIVSFDIQFAGILPRYLSDFTWLLIIPTLIILFYNDVNLELDKLNSFRKLFLILLFISLCYQFCLLFIYVDVSFEKFSPNNFYQVYYFIQFWL